MFPFDIEDEEVDVEVEEAKEPADYEIDFETGNLTGRIITGLDAIIQRAMIVLNTDRYFYSQYSWDHGSELNQLIGQNYDKDYIESEVKRMVSEALMTDENILDVTDFSDFMQNEKLTGSFTIDTVYGRRELSV